MEAAILELNEWRLAISLAIENARGVHVDAHVENAPEQIVGKCGGVCGGVSGEVAAGLAVF